MEENTTQLEVLLMVGTSFSSRQYGEKENTGNHKNPSEKERLEEACWNGFLPEMLPEIYASINKAEPLYLWKVREGVSFLELELGDTPSKKEDGWFSVNPYLFMEQQCGN